jgi:hypothetical protein
LPTVGGLGKYKVKVHARDHNPPHVHFETAEIVVRIDIVHLAVLSIEGQPTRKELRIMLNYVENFQEELKGFWNDYQKKN